MQDSQEQTTNIKKLKSLQKHYIEMAEEAGAEIYRVNNMYVLFEIPNYGGEPRYIGTYFKPEKVIETVFSWI